MAYIYRTRPLLVCLSAFIVLVGGFVLRHHSAANRPASPPTHLLIRAVIDPAPLPVVISGKPTKPSGATLPATLAQALRNEGQPFNARLRAINALGTDLGAAELAAALDYVRDPAPADGLSIDQRAALKNDLINRLRAQTNPPAELTPALLGLFVDRSSGPVLRDYAIQHLAEWRSAAPAADRPAIDGLLWEAATTPEPLAGTALLALCRQAEAAPKNSPDRKRLMQTTTAVARDRSAPEAARVTALSVATRANSPDLAALALTCLADKPSIPRQLAALTALEHALAQKWQPKPADLAILQAMEKGRNPQVRAKFAAVKARLPAS